MNISRDGVGVCVDQDFAPGCFVALRLRSPRLSPQPLLMRVIHARRLPDGRTLLGGTWLRPLLPCHRDALLEMTGPGC